MLSCHNGCGPMCGCAVEDQFCVFYCMLHEIVGWGI